ncbi:MAG: sodium:proton antiporter, partial [Oscillospiraceae bacterium]|nr:sodium:proton antiporter [Oscillospiraceae bacterium]
MEVTTIVIVVLLAIVLSNVLHHLFPRLPLTLSQIGVGCLFGLALPGGTLELEPEIFMVLVIAPLLFREAEETDLLSLWRVRRPVFLMAFLLVFITVFAVGLAAHWLVPALPTAACFALGAILGPTDVVAVSSLSSRIKVGEKLMSILMGEGLINDASGLIAFHFAVAALLTGTFSAAEASLRLLLVAVGGALVGLALIGVKQHVTMRMRRLSIENTSAYMLIELLMPFLSYVTAELCGLSGVLAAVAAGSRQALTFKQTELFEAELGDTTHTMWDMVGFTLNSLVFLLLGIQLPGIIRHIWSDDQYSHGFLLLTAALLTLILMAVRFCSVSLIARGDLGAGRSEKLRNAIVLTLSGVKGTVSLATAFALPFFYADGTSFAERPLLLFLTAGVIVLSLSLALLFLPVVAGAPVGQIERDPQIDILKEVVAQLRKQEGDVSEVVISNYQRRIQKLERAECNRAETAKLRALRIRLYGEERRALRQRYQKKEFDAATYRDYTELLEVIHHRAARGLLMALFAWFARIGPHHPRHALSEADVKQRRRKLQEMFRVDTEVAMETLQALRGEYPDKLVDILATERAELAEKMEQNFSHVFTARLHRLRDDEMLKGYYVERRVIHQFLERGKITPAQANDLRLKVNKMETFTLSHGDNEVVVKLMSLLAR